MSIFKQIRLLNQRHEVSRLLISELEQRHLVLLREVQEIREQLKEVRNANV